jgi:hypothetical protein
MLCNADGMATIGEEGGLSDEEGALRAGGPSAGFHSNEGSSRQYQQELDEHEFDSMRNSM